MDNYIKELQENFRKYKIEESVDNTQWKKRVSTTYHYRLCDKHGIPIHHFEFGVQKTKDELEKAYIKAMC